MAIPVFLDFEGLYLKSDAIKKHLLKTGLYEDESEEAAYQPYIDFFHASNSPRIKGEAAMYATPCYGGREGWVDHAFQVDLA